MLLMFYTLLVQLLESKFSGTGIDHSANCTTAQLRSYLETSLMLGIL